MNLYRLDSAAGPVRTFAGDYLSRSLVKARHRGAAEASERGETITLSAIRNGGHLRPFLSIAPSGKVSRIPLDSRGRRL